MIKGRSDQKSFLTVRDVVIRDVITSHPVIRGWPVPFYKFIRKLTITSGTFNATPLEELKLYQFKPRCN